VFRAVITGIGLVTPIGISRKCYWESAISGRNGVRRITRFDASKFSSQIAGQVSEQDLQPYLTPRIKKRLSRFSQFALIAGKLAIDDAGVNGDHSIHEHMDVVIGISSPGFAEWEDAAKKLAHKGPAGVSPRCISTCSPILAASCIIEECKLGGEGIILSTGCSSGLSAIGYGLCKIRWGQSKCVLVGGIDAPLSPTLMAMFCNARLLSRRNDLSECASRPFDRERDGLVMAEGAGLLLLEEYEHAKKRRARIYAELRGHAAKFNLEYPDDKGENIRKASNCIATALKDGKVASDEVGYFCAHGSSSVCGDRDETATIKRVFKRQAYRMNVSSVKSMIGHPLAASGGIQAATCALSIYTKSICPTVNYQYKDPECDLDYVPNEARNEKLTAAMAFSTAVGGNCSALVMSAC